MTNIAVHDASGVGGVERVGDVDRISEPLFGGIYWQSLCELVCET
jgi:hypothetical protein